MCTERISVQPCNSSGESNKMKRILTVFTVGIFLASSAYAQRNNKLDQDLNNKVKDYKDSQSNSNGSDKGKEVVRVILKTLPSLKNAAELEAKKLGGKELKHFQYLSANVIQISVNALEQLTKHPGVHSISLDVPVRTT